VVYSLQDDKNGSLHFSGSNKWLFPVCTCVGVGAYSNAGYHRIFFLPFFPSHIRWMGIFRRACLSFIESSCREKTFGKKESCISSRQGKRKMNGLSTEFTNPLRQNQHTVGHVCNK